MYSIMDICTGEIEAGSVDSGDYDTEVLCAGWNPGVAAMRQEHAQLAVQVIDRAAHGEMPPDVAVANLDAFLERMYLSQR